MASDDENDQKITKKREIKLAALMQIKRTALKTIKMMETHI